MWHPDPSWDRLPSGPSTVTEGVWLDGAVVVKRLRAPERGDPSELSDPHSHAYWRRPAEVAWSGVVDHTPGLRGPRTLEAAEDAHGITLRQPYVDERPPSGEFCARGLGRFAAADLGDRPWLARHQLADRLARVAHRGGWPTLARTTVADVADRLWRRRETHLDAVAALPQVAQHGDPTPDNLLSHDGLDVVAIDWATLGTGPLGGDLGYLALSMAEPLEQLADAYVAALPDGLDAGLDEVLVGARVHAVYTAFSRAEWALARAASGGGALAGKFNHPSVAPYLRALERLDAHVEALL